MGISLNLDGSGLARSFILRRMSRYVNEAFESMGRERVDILIRYNLDLTHFMSSEQMDQLKQLGLQYHWISRIITHKDVFVALPQWTQEMIKSEGVSGGEWFLRQYNLLQQFLGGDPT